MTEVPRGLRDPARLDALRRVKVMVTPPSESFDRLARLAARVMDTPGGMVNFVDDERQYLKGCFGQPARSMPTDRGFCPLVVTTGKPLVVNNATVDARFADDPVVSQMGVTAYAGVPLIDADGHTLGTICAFDFGPRAWSDADLQALDDLAGATLSRVELDLAKDEQRQLFEVFENAPLLVAMTRGSDHRLTFANAMHAKLLGLSALGTPTAGAVPRQKEHEAHYEQMDRAYGEGQPTYLDEVPLGDRDIPYTFVYSPLFDTTGQVEGLLHIGIEVSELVAAREARLAGEQHIREIALTLQESMLPAALSQPELLQVAAKYLAGVDDRDQAAEDGDADGDGQALVVGGDWYDVIPLGVGRTALVIGDVMGRGVHAAAVMGQLRTAVRAYARLDLRPTLILELLNGVLQELAPDQIVTCVYAVFDPAERDLTYANAGHLPPLVIGPSGPVRRLDETRGAPLGVGEQAYEAGRIKLEPGTMMALYTDGLVEERHRDIDEGIGELGAALAESKGPLNAACELVLKRLRIPTRQADDVALLLFRVPQPSEAAMETAIVQLGEDMSSAPAARHFTAGTLAGWAIGEPVAGQAMLAVSELVSNSLVHAESEVELRLRRTPGQLHVEVRDSSTYLPAPSSSDLFDEGGRGLQLVAHFAKRWGARHTEAGKSVWCEFDLAPEDA